MPWCEPCARYWAQPSAGPCPDCGGDLDPGRVATRHADEEGPLPRPPWHFWIFVIAAAVYLGWRAVEGIIWVATRLF